MSYDPVTSNTGLRYVFWVLVAAALMVAGSAFVDYSLHKAKPAIETKASEAMRAMDSSMMAGVPRRY